MNIEEKLKLITRNCQEVLVFNELKSLVESEKPIKHYIGFEISGMVHLGTGLISMGKIADFVNAGMECNILLADYHSFLNDKLGGDWEKIRWATENYFKEALIASLKCFEVDLSKINFIYAKDFYKENPVIWDNLLKVSKHITLSRNLRSISITGKEAGEDVDMATLIYPPLQVADIFTIGVDIAHAGMDQRKAHVVARDVAKKLDWKSPICIHHNLIAGLTAPQLRGSASLQEQKEELKMSKSKPNSAIYIHDSEEEIRAKIKKAYCPPAIVEFNPIIDWVKTLMFWGDEENSEYIKLIEDFKSGALHPMDLKEKVANWLVEKLKPAREYFEDSTRKENLEKFKTLLSA